MDFFSGTFDASDFISSTTASVGSTFDSVGPVVGLVAGIVLAFIFVPVLISWVRSVRRGK